MAALLLCVSCGGGGDEGTGGATDADPGPGLCEGDGSPAGGPRIAYVAATADDGGVLEPEVCAMDPDGAGQRRLSTGDAPLVETSNFAWSVDGERLACADDDVCVVDADEGGLANVTAGAAVDSDPAWSPDGQKVAFAREEQGAGGGIHVVDADGGAPTSLIPYPAGEGLPSYSPDGRRLALNSATSGSVAVHAANADGTGLTRLAERSAYERLAWSPDGARIAYDSLEGGDTDVYVAAADGSAEARPTGSGGHGEHPSWSPDGGSVAFRCSFGGGPRGICVADPEGSSEPRLLLEDAGGIEYDSPAWQPAVPSGGS